jgi:hypothetical protein
MEVVQTGPVADDDVVRSRSQPRDVDGVRVRESTSNPSFVPTVA